MIKLKELILVKKSIKKRDICPYWYFVNIGFGNDVYEPYQYCYFKH